MFIDYENSKEYYENYTPCDCELCNNYYSHVIDAYPKIKEYLESIGVDILKPFELSPIEDEEEQKIEYSGCQYVVFGECEDNFKLEIDGIEFFNNIDTHPSDEEIIERHFIIDLGPIVLKWK